MIIALFIVIVFILAQPSTQIDMLTAEEMRAHPKKEECAHVMITRFESLRAINPAIPIVILDTVLCDGDGLEINGREIKPQEGSEKR